MKIHLAALAAAVATITSIAALAERTAIDTLDRGRYLVRIGGCNDCHTPGYSESAGKLPEAQWLTGSAVGFQGPWGTTYPANLRLTVARMTEAQWLARAKSEMRPPMPWFNLREMSDDDLRAMYRYIDHLDAAGDPAPAYAAPGEKVGTPYIVFEPQNLPQRHARTN